VSELVEWLLRSDSIIASTWLRCVDCEDETNMDNDLQTCVIQLPDDQDCTTSECLQKRFQQRHPRPQCAPCGGKVDKIICFDMIPKVLVFSGQNSSIKVSTKICFRDGEERVVFVLRGIVYFGDFHYTACVCVRGSVWFHNGMGTGKNCLNLQIPNCLNAEAKYCRKQYIPSIKPVHPPPIGSHLHLSANIQSVDSECVQVSCFTWIILVQSMELHTSYMRFKSGQEPSEMAAQVSRIFSIHTVDCIPVN
jgi:hypothetical protein